MAALDSLDDDVRMLRNAALQYEAEQRQMSLIDAQPKPEPTWRERLWEAPPATRLGMRELQEALGRSRRWIQDQMKRTDDPLPHRRETGGGVLFVAGEIRQWQERREVRIA